MNIVITTGIFRPELGGPATMAVELARRLTTLGHRVTVITYSDKAKYDFDKEYQFKLIRVTRSTNKFVNYFRYFLTVLFYARKARIIYSLDWFSAGLPVLLATTLLGKNYGVRVGGGYIWEKYLSEGKKPVTLKDFYEKGLYKHYKLMFFIITRVLKNAAYVVFNSDEQRLLYNTYYNLSKNKTVTIFNATPEHKFGTLVQSYGHTVHEHDKEIVYAGRFIKMKNIEAAIRAFARLYDKDYTFLIIGDGPEQNYLRTLVHELELSQRVTFMPPMSQLDLYRRIARAAYVILPSWTDVSPHQAYECLSLGIPILLTQENYLSINKYQFLKIDPNSVEDIAAKMNWLLDPQHYAEFLQQLHTIQYKHSWEEVIREHLTLFKALL